LPHQIDHLLEQPELIVVPHTAAEDDALPWLGAQGTGHDGLRVAPVETEQANLNADAALSGSRCEDSPESRSALSNLGMGD